MAMAVRLAGRAALEATARCGFGVVEVLAPALSPAAACARWPLAEERGTALSFSSSSSSSSSFASSKWAQEGLERAMTSDAAEPLEPDEGPDAGSGPGAFPPEDEASAFESKMPVNAYYLGKDVCVERIGESALFGSLEQTARNDHVTIDITPLMGRPARQSLVTFTAPPEQQQQQAEAGEAEGAGGEHRGAEDSTYCALVTSYESSFVVAFRYGGVVFFNVEDPVARGRYLGEISRCASAGASGFGADRPPSKSEDFSVVVDARQREWSRLQNDNLRLRCLDLNNIVVISSVLGQSVALDHYHSRADSMLRDFSRINLEMEQTGNFNMPRRHLFQVVAQTNTTYSDSITKIKLLEKPSDAAWKYAHYGAIWEQLRGEFELEERFQRLSLKLELMQQNVKYFLEILQNRKSNTLEWIIIVLIAGEIMLCLYDIYERRAEKAEKERKQRELEHRGGDLDLGHG